MECKEDVIVAMVVGELYSSYIFISFHNLSKRLVIDRRIFKLFRTTLPGSTNALKPDLPGLELPTLELPALDMPVFDYEK